MNNEPYATVATFNCEWRKPLSADGNLINQRVSESDPDIVCLTETYADVFTGGHSLTSRADYGYKTALGRRKVVIWSKKPWSCQDDFGSTEFPPGRFVTARTSTPIGEVQVVGVCIPWADAHVRSGARNRERWSDHVAYLAALQGQLARIAGDIILLGDFNQRVPRLWQPQHVFDALVHTLGDRLSIATTGLQGPTGNQAIDHICHTSGLRAVSTAAICNLKPNGGKISDHFGATVNLSKRLQEG